MVCGLVKLSRASHHSLGLASCHSSFSMNIFLIFMVLTEKNSQKTKDREMILISLIIL